MLVAALFFLGLALASTWAAGHPAGAGKRLPARLLCYAELYLPTLLLLLASLVLLALGPTYWLPGAPGEVPWGRYAGLWAALAVLPVLASAGVARRWHPLARAGLYAGWAGLMAAVLKAAGAF